MVGLAPPDFLWGSVESPNFMRLSLQEAAHANLVGAAYRKSGSPVFFVPRTLGRTWGTRPLLSPHLDGGSQMLDVAGLPQSEFIPRSSL